MSLLLAKIAQVHRGNLGVDPSTDPHFHNVVSLIHFDDGNGSTDFKDEIGPVWSHAGSAIESNSNPRFGSGAMQITQPGYIASPLENPGSIDFTIECSFVLDSMSSQNAIFSYCKLGDNSTTRIVVLVNTNGSVVAWSDKGGISMTSSPGLVSTGTYHTIALSKSGGTVNLLLDGNIVAFQTGRGSLDTGGLSKQMYLGYAMYAGHQYLSGQIDEFRATYGVGRYNSNYIPRSSPFPSS